VIVIVIVRGFSKSNSNDINPIFYL
jgi:hypothetical protein